MDSRFPRSLYRRGAEPDPRFSLANERTFLAWVRTSLAMLAAGVALIALDVGVSAGFRVASASVFVVLGVLCAVQAWIGWYRTERSLRESRPLPGAALAPALTIGVVLAVVLLVLGLLW